MTLCVQKIILGLLKDLDVVSRNSIKDELASPDTLLCNIGFTASPDHRLHSPHKTFLPSTPITRLIIRLQTPSTSGPPQSIYPLFMTTTTHNNNRQTAVASTTTTNAPHSSDSFAFFVPFSRFSSYWHSSKIQQDHARRERDISYQLRSRPSMCQRRLQRSTSTATRVTRARFTHTRHNSASLICTKSGKYLIVVPGHRRRTSLGAYRDYRPALPRALPAFPLIILGSILQYHDDARGVRLRTR